MIRFTPVYLCQCSCPVVVLMHPDSFCVALTLADFVKTVLPVQHTLKTLTHEMGDSWIYGASTDPIKVATYRAAMRTRKSCRKHGRWQDDGAPEEMFDRFLMKECALSWFSLACVPLAHSFVAIACRGEHTWGLSGGQCKRMSFNSTHEQLLAARNLTCVQTWQEQRQFIQNAVQALVDSKHACADDFVSELAEISPSGLTTGKWPITPHSQAGFAEISDPAGKKIALQGGGSVVFDTGGSIVSLRPSATSADLASPADPLAHFHYQTLSANDMSAWVKDYGALSRPNFNNFAAPGEATSGSSIGATGYETNATLQTLKAKRNSDGSVSSVLLSADLPGLGVQQAGAPQMVETLFEFGEHGVNISLHMLNKMPTKHKETAWLSFTPPFTAGKSTLEISKIGSWLDPADVLPFPGSNMHLHAIDQGARWTGVGGGGAFYIEPLDSALVSVGDANPAPTSAKDGAKPYRKSPAGGGLTPDPSGGLHFSLVNNQWNTNYREPLSILVRLCTCGAL